jgi:hypothetical protein
MADLEPRRCSAALHPANLAIETARSVECGIETASPERPTIPLHPSFRLRDLPRGIREPGDVLVSLHRGTPGGVASRDATLKWRTVTWAPARSCVRLTGFYPLDPKTRVASAGQHRRVLTGSDACRSGSAHRFDIPDQGRGPDLKAGTAPCRGARTSEEAPVYRFSLDRIPRRGVPHPLRSAFAVSHDLDGLLLSAPSGMFQPDTLVELLPRKQRPAGVPGRV